MVFLSFIIIQNIHKFFIPNKTALSTVLLGRFQSSRELWNLLSKAVLGKYHGFDGHRNATVYKTEPIFTGLGRGKLSLF